jgi:hypothetical protein
MTMTSKQLETLRLLDKRGDITLLDKLGRDDFRIDRDGVAWVPIDKRAYSELYLRFAPQWGWSVVFNTQSVREATTLGESHAVAIEMLPSLPKPPRTAEEKTRWQLSEIFNSRSSDP